MSPLITCVIPVCDGERYLRDAIASILAQDHRPIEVVVVDDASTDSTAAIAESFGPPVRLVRQEQNGGGPAARNRGIREARGEYISFLDADDLYRPTKLSTQLRYLAADPALDLCECMAENFWEPGLEAERDRYIAAGRLLITHHFATLLAHRSVFERVGPLEERRLSGDYIDWFQRATDAGLTSRVVPDVLMERRMHPASQSHSLGKMDDYFALAQARIARHRAS
ncbi:MAG TPA: glycosyltransferase family A protein [Gaiellaceae bacterium]|jgi:glycosyltransferase involved in cell wall biosynthesis|nr:glycosyltransferase family A protein [Gaiellaceae bacterium]